MQLPRTIRYWLEPWEYDSQGRKRFGTWGQAYSGQEYWIMDPRADEIHLVDVCVGLLNASRYRGQTKFFYPVLTHSVIVSEQAEKIALERGWTVQEAREAGLEGLFHDAAEAYIGDVARPLKRMRAMRGYRKIEALWEEAVFERFNVKSTSKSQELIQEVDWRICVDEVQKVMKDPQMWDKKWQKFGISPLGVNIPDLPRPTALLNFVNRYNDLNKGTQCVVK